MPYSQIFSLKQITCVKPNILCCDGFIEFHFIDEALEEILHKAIELRTLLLNSVELKLNNDEYADCRELCKKIVKFSRIQHSFRFVILDFLRDYILNVLALFFLCKILIMFLD